MTLNAFFVEKEIALDALIGICCDGEPTNTGVRNGILRRFQLHLNRPLHWFLCLLHFNEPPFRHLFDTLDKSSTTGPRTTTGRLGKQIETCENLPVCIICHFSHWFFPLLNGKIAFNWSNFIFSACRWIRDNRASEHATWFRSNWIIHRFKVLIQNGQCNFEWCCSCGFFSH